MTLVHHELCFGCGRTNLFGLMLEVEPTSPGSVAGRCFIKQDHQGARKGASHDGIVAAALSEAMAFACGEDSRATALEVQFVAPAPIGAFLQIEARVEQRDGQSMRAVATASADGGPVATARGTYQSGLRGTR